MANQENVEIVPAHFLILSPVADLETGSSGGVSLPCFPPLLGKENGHAKPIFKISSLSTHLLVRYGGSLSISRIARGDRARQPGLGLRKHFHPCRMDHVRAERIETTVLESLKVLATDPEQLGHWLDIYAKGP